jgi:hypothetical protein
MLLEGCVNLYFTYGASVMFRYAHAPWAQTLRATSGPLTYSLVYVIAAALYWRIAPSRHGSGFWQSSAPSMRRTSFCRTKAS